MIELRNLTLPPDHTAKQLKKAAAKQLRVPLEALTDLQITRRSLDARQKDNIHWVYTLCVSVSGDEQKVLRRGGSMVSQVRDTHYEPPKADKIPEHRPVVVGFGPAGMFATLILAEAGLRPIVLERGYDAQKRHGAVEKFWKTGVFDPVSNVQFGEGGAGTFSDGKLNTGTHNLRNHWVLEQLVRFGGGPQLLYDAKPHVGTDVLLKVVQNLRNYAVSLGAELHFESTLTNIQKQNGAIKSVTVSGPNGTWELPCEKLILATGHSARDTFSMLETLGLPLEPKPFAMGVRMEHPQALINESQYGDFKKGLPPADYKLVQHLQDRSVYTFCMCPGGYVVAAASEEGGIVTNGMSYSGRSGENANSALLASLTPKDFPYEGPLGGMYWQRELEQKAYQFSGSYRAPAQNVADFLLNRESVEFSGVTPTYAPGVVPANLRELLPDCISEALAEALPLLDRKLHGLASGVLTGPETRSSSPVRILRNEACESLLSGLYPCGEGAGYAGGILSAAVDGIRCGEAIVKAYQNQEA